MTTTTAQTKRGPSRFCVAKRHRSVQHEIEATGVMVRRVVQSKRGQVSYRGFSPQENAP